MFPKLLGKCIHYYSLHAIYFLIRCSIEPEAGFLCGIREDVLEAADQLLATIQKP